MLLLICFPLPPLSPPLSVQTVGAGGKKVVVWGGGRGRSEHMGGVGAFFLCLCFQGGGGDGVGGDSRRVTYC